MSHLQGTPMCMVRCAWAGSSGWGIPVQCPQVIPEGEDVYDWCLTQAEIQGNINKVNGEQSWAFLLGDLQGLWWDRGSPGCGESGGCSRKKSAQASPRPSGKKDWVCTSKEKFK